MKFFWVKLGVDSAVLCAGESFGFEKSFWCDANGNKGNNIVRVPCIL